VPRSRHEEARLGPHHQHGIGAFAGRFAFKSAYVSAKHGMPLTRPWRWRSRPSRSPAMHQPWLCWTPLVEHQIPETMKART